MRLGVRRTRDFVIFLVMQAAAQNYFEGNHLASGCPVRAASVTCLIASTVIWACSLFHSSPEVVGNVAGQP
jgi:hypothetical protein